MKNQNTSRDYELLSAYLDNQLGSQERAILELRLKAEPELRKEFHEISSTRFLLRSMPKMRAPRNYYVTEKDTKTARTRGFQRLAPAYGIVSAIATILLVLLIFGDRLLTSTSQVVFAPASIAPISSVAVQKEGERNVVSTSSPTQAPPVMMVQAPAIASTESPSAEILAGGGEIATPTTIYLNALPPTSTPEITTSVMADQSITTTISCDGSKVSQPFPTIPYACPSSTSSPSEFLMGILTTVSPTLTDTPTPAQTSASALDQNSPSTPTQTSTSTPTLTSTSTPTTIPSSTPTSTASPTETPALVQNTAPQSVVVGPTLPAPSDQVMGVANLTPTEPSPTETSRNSLNFDFLQYIVLAIELSLAAIAIAAGIIAIILRIRAGR